MGRTRSSPPDLRVRVRATGLATYLDATVICGDLERDPEDSNAVVNPTVLIEVRSESTAVYDAGEKFAHFKQIAQLRELVLVSHRERRVEVRSLAPGSTGRPLWRAAWGRCISPPSVPTFQ